MLFGKKGVGIDIGSHSIKIVVLEQTKKGYQLVSLGKCLLPPEAIVDKSFIDTLALANALKVLIDNLKVKKKDVALSVSGGSVIVKKISQPLMNEKELEETLMAEAEQHIPFPLQDVNIDFHILGPNKDKEDEMDIILAAVKKEMIQDYASLAHEVGLNPVVIDVDSFALENMFELNYPIEEGEVVALINMGANLININILRGNTSMMVRDITLGGSSFTREIQKTLNLDYQTAERLKIEGKVEGIKSERVKPIMENLLNSLAIEVDRSLNFFSSSYGEQRINKIYLSGGCAKIAGIDKFIEGKIDTPTEIIDPFKNIYWNADRFDPDYIKDMAPLAAVGVGLAIRKAEDKWSA